MESINKSKDTPVPRLGVGGREGVPFCPQVALVLIALQVPGNFRTGLEGLKVLAEDCWPSLFRESPQTTLDPPHV